MKKDNLYIAITIIVIGLIVGASFLSKSAPTNPSQIDLQLGAKAASDTSATTAGQGLDALPPVTASDHIRGSINAPVKIVVYTDLECPFCIRFHPELNKAFADYGNSGQLAIIYRNFPIVSLHPKAPKEAEASECVAEIGGNNKYWLFVDKIFSETPGNNQLNPTKLPEFAKAVGIDLTAFNTCLASGKYAAKIDASIMEAGKLGAQGTPFPVIITKSGKTALGGYVPYEQFKPLIEAGLK